MVAGAAVPVVEQTEQQAAGGDARKTLARGAGVGQGEGGGNERERPRQGEREEAGAAELQRERSLTVGFVDFLFPDGDQRAVGEAEQTEENQRGREGGEHDVGLGEGEDGGAAAEKEGDADFLGGAPGMMAMDQLVGKQVEADGREQDEPGGKFGGGEATEGDGEVGDEADEPQCGERPAGTLIEKMPLGANLAGLQAPAFDPAVGDVGEPDGDAQDEGVGPAGMRAGDPHELPLPEHGHGGGVERQNGGPLPPIRLAGHEGLHGWSKTDGRGVAMSADVI